MNQHQAHEEHSVKPRHWIRKQFSVSFGILAGLILITFFVVLYARGYRVGFGEGTPQLAKTGILNTASLPTGAQVYVNDHLTTATNNSINLTPGQYTVKIAKEGYNDWQKNVQILQEVVTNANALLFPKAPTLRSISTFGIESPVIDPSGTKLAFRIASQSARRDGIYVLDMTKNGFPVLAGQSSSTLIANDTIDAFSKSTITWSPDGEQLLASIPGELSSTYYLLKADGVNENPQDVTATLSSVEESWAAQRRDKEAAQLRSLKPQVQKYVKGNMRIIAWSPDDTKILYQASSSGTMPTFLKPRRIGNNALYERRDIEENAIYVYDVKEDFNTRIVEGGDAYCPEEVNLYSCTTPFTWFPDSDHIIYVHDKKVDVVENDGSNLTTLYAGPFVEPYVYPWPDASKIVIMTNLGNTSIPPTLYTIGLK